MTGEQYGPIGKIWHRLKAFWPHDDSPGYTDSPRVDIKAHRANAEVTEWVGLGMLIIGIAGTSAWGDLGYALGGVAIAMLSFWISMNFRVQALEWELQLERGDG